MNILVPKPDNIKRKLIKSGSGIVAAERTDGSADVYFEGNLYGAENLSTYWGRLLCAAGRLSQHYPTVAYLVDNAWRENFDLIGTFDYDGLSKALQPDPTDPRPPIDHSMIDDVIKRFCRIESEKYPMLIDWLESKNEAYR